MIECPDCGRLFANVAGRNIHRGRVHAKPDPIGWQPDGSFSLPDDPADWPLVGPPPEGTLRSARIVPGPHSGSDVAGPHD